MRSCPRGCASKYLAEGHVVSRRGHHSHLDTLNPFLFYKILVNINALFFFSKCNTKHVMIWTKIIFLYFFLATTVFDLYLC